MKRTIIEVIGSPDSGKTTALRTVSSTLSSIGITNEFIVETRGKNLFPKSHRGTIEYNMKIGEFTCKKILNILANSKAEIILIDKGYVDYLYFVHYYEFFGKCTKEEAHEAKLLFKDYNLLPDKLIAMWCNSEVALQRCEDPIETRTVKVQKSIDCLLDFYYHWNLTDANLINTSYLGKDEVAKRILSLII